MTSLQKRKYGGGEMTQGSRAFAAFGKAQHPHGGLQLPVTPGPGDSMASCMYLVRTYMYINKQGREGGSMSPEKMYMQMFI